MEIEEGLNGAMGDEGRGPSEGQSGGDRGKSERRGIGVSSVRVECTFRADTVQRSANDSSGAGVERGESGRADGVNGE